MSLSSKSRQELLVVLILCLQALLLFTNLDLLPIWGDELFTLTTVQKPVPDIISAVRSDIHPPLYFLLLHVWPWREIVGLRAFSAAWALASVWLLDRLWIKNWRTGDRMLTLALFAFSPCLLLYGRMARSYSMQMAVALVTIWCLWNWLRTGRGALAAFVSATLLLYTHYVPGLAILAGFTMVAFPKLGARRVLLFLAAVAAGYFPWLLTLSAALRHWGEGSGFSSRYTITGSMVLEQILKAGYGGVALSIGETFHVVSLVMAPVILGLALLGAWRARRVAGGLVAMLAIALIVGFLGVSRWVSYPFIPARLLWMLPFLSVAMVYGLRQLPGKTQILAGLILLSFGTSTLFYFQRKNYLNKGYNAPLREIAAELNRDAGANDLIVVDAYDADAALQHYVRSPAPFIVLTSAEEDSARRQVEQARTIWIVRNQRDVSPGHLTSRIESLACASGERTETDYSPIEAWEKPLVAAIAGERLTHFYEMVKCSPRRAVP